MARAVADAGASMPVRRRLQAAHVAVLFQGLGYEALDILAEVRAEIGLPVVTEMTAAELADRFAETVDVIQVGARNMQNYGLLEVVGKLGKPVLPRGLPRRSRSCSRRRTTSSRRATAT